MRILLRRGAMDLSRDDRGYLLSLETFRYLSGVKPPGGGRMTQGKSSSDTVSSSGWQGAKPGPTILVLLLGVILYFGLPVVMPVPDARVFAGQPAPPKPAAAVAAPAERSAALAPATPLKTPSGAEQETVARAATTAKAKAEAEANAMADAETKAKRTAEAARRADWVRGL